MTYTSNHPTSNHFKRCQLDDIIFFFRCVHHWLTGRRSFQPKNIIPSKPVKCSWKFTSNVFLWTISVSIKLPKLVFHRKKNSHKLFCNQLCNLIVIKPKMTDKIHHAIISKNYKNHKKNFSSWTHGILLGIAEEN